MQSFDVVVIGAGAAGLKCAMAAAQRGRRVLLLEGSNKIGKKILMSGGGRCNFTNLDCSPADFESSNPDFCISALSRYTPHDFLAMVEAHRIAWHEKTAGQLFCNNSSKDILGMLTAECERAGVSIVTHCRIDSVVRGNGFEIAVDRGGYRCESLVIASGGLSIPKMGASDFGYRLARQFDLRILQTRPGLVPYTFSGAVRDMTSRLSGVSLPVAITLQRQTFEGSMLFTHRGISGPAALQSSNFWSEGAMLDVDLLPGVDAGKLLLQAKREQPKARLRSVLDDGIPRALVLELQALWWAAVAQQPVGEISDKLLHRVADKLKRWSLRPSGTEGYRTAEVTLGGVDTSELSSTTFECRDQPGLYFVGEVLDVTGKLGGYNFQWAWSSGHAAGQAV